MTVPLKTSTPYRSLSVYEPPLTLTIVAPVPFTYTPEPRELLGPKGLVPLSSTNTLFKVTILAFRIDIPFKSLFAAFT